MLKHLRITVDGKPYDVVVEDVSEEPGGTLYPSPGSMSPPIRTGAPSSTPSATPAAPAVSSDADKLAPLGGVVVDISVSVGSSVKAGDKIMTIEAMKMKTAVSAHRDGTVKSVPVKVGDAVDAGQVLVTIE